jgi:hypothetical protein
MTFRWRSGISAVISLTCLGLGVCLPGPVSAATPVSDNAIRVSPTSSNVTLSAGETSTTIDATVTNLTSSPLHVGLSSQDFSASSSQAGAIQLYGSGYNPHTNPHDLQTAVSFASPVILLAPKQTQKVVIALNDLSALAPGGHYGAVLFSPEPDYGSTGTNVSISSSVASLIFLSTSSGGTESLGLTSFSIGAVEFSLPRSTVLAFQDTGNTQTSPQGQLTLYGPTGKIVSTTVINPGAGLVLPGTIRLFTTELPLAGLRFARPGVYRLELQYNGRTDTTFTVVNKRFLYINVVVVIPFLLVCALLVLILKRYGSSMGKGLLWLLRLTEKLRKKKQAPPPPAEKPKHPPRLIQG